MNQEKERISDLGEKIGIQKEIVEKSQVVNLDELAETAEIIWDFAQTGKFDKLLGHIKKH